MTTETEIRQWVARKELPIAVWREQYKWIHLCQDEKDMLFWQIDMKKQHGREWLINWQKEENKQNAASAKANKKKDRSKSGGE